MTDKQYRGNVKYWNSHGRNFGFITMLDGDILREVFFHRDGTNLEENREPQYDEVVTFNLTKDERDRYRALNVIFPPLPQDEGEVEETENTTEEG